MHAAGLPLRDERAAVDFDGAQGARHQVPRAVEPDRARQRALHRLLALRALHARDLEIACARHPEPRRRLAGAGGRGQEPRRRSVFGQRHRHLPGRGAAGQAVPAQGARLVSQGDAIGLPGLQPRLHGRPLAPQAGMEAQCARSAREHGDCARDATREPCGQRPVDLQQGTRPGADLRAAARAERDVEGSADQPRRCDCRRATPDRPGPAARGAGLELGLERGTGGVRGRARRPARLHRQVRLAACCRASPSRTTC